MEMKSDTEGPVVALPYYCGIGEEVKRLGLSHKFRVYFKSSPNLRALIRNDMIKVSIDQTPGVVYEILCDCHASYIGETGNTLFRRIGEHITVVTRYKNAEQRLIGTQTGRRGRPPTLSPKESMDEAKRASAVVEHTSQYSLNLHPRIICRESMFHLRQMMESLFIRHNATINRDKGREVSEVWNTIISKSKCCTIPPGPPTQPINSDSDRLNYHNHRSLTTEPERSESSEG
uniref:GIY-YIG domain-containing protein n=1 Tax=Trichuris muris TaxID=70415 RepID=A0A5S6QMH4_TRIMR